jgi:hypothetical protein
VHYRQNLSARKILILLVITLMSISGVLGQVQQQLGQDQLRNQRGAPFKKTRPNAGDPLAKTAGTIQRPVTGLTYYTFRLRSFDGTPLAASYYPSRLGNSAAVVMLVHEIGRSRKDFEDPIQDLKGQGLAEYLQGQGYAVLSIDLRWQGQNPRRALTAAERPKLIEDLQAGYFFLVDRHNRGDLNLAKLGVIALSDGANLAIAWAVQPGAAITIQGKSSDLSALALISPNPDGFGYMLGHGITILATRVPLLLVAGERDIPSNDAVHSVRQTVQRVRLNKIELFPSSLHGYKLLRLEPKIIPAIIHFLDSTVKNRPVEWEPQYNLTPVTVGDFQFVQKEKQAETAKSKSKYVSINPQKEPENSPKAESRKGRPGAVKEESVPGSSTKPP